MNVLFLLTLLTSAFFATASVTESPVSNIVDPDIVCESEGAKYAFAMKPVGRERVWQADPGDDMGLELSVTEFSRLRCPHCYDIKAELYVLGQTVEMDLTLRRLRGEHGNRIGLTVTIQGTDVKLDCGPSSF